MDSVNTQTAERWNRSMLLADQLKASVSHWCWFLSAFWLQMCLNLDVFEVFRLSRTSKVASLGCPMYRHSGDSPRNRVRDTSELTEDPAGLLTDEEACSIAFGQTFFPKVSKCLGLYLLELVTNLLHLQHCPAQPSVGSLHAGTWTLPWMQWPSQRKG